MHQTNEDLPDPHSSLCQKPVFDFFCFALDVCIVKLLLK